MQSTRSRDNLFRDEALRAHISSRGSDGDLLRISPGWTNWLYWLLVAICLTGLTYLIFGRVNEYAAGAAIVRGEDRADIYAVSGGAITEIVVRPGQRVKANQLLARLYDVPEAAELERLDREYELQLLKSLNSPHDAVSQQQLAFMRERKQVVAARLNERRITAPRAGTIKDVRIRPGQTVAPGELLLSLDGAEEKLSVVALLPGHYRPLLQKGAPLRLELNGFKYAYQHLTIDLVAEDVIGPNEARKYLGEQVSDSLALQGPVVIVKADLPSRNFTSDDGQYAFHDGMQGRAEVRVRSDRLILALLPSIKTLWGGRPCNSSSDTGALVERFPALKKLDPGQSSRRIPYVQQMSATECGAACLTMALAWFGKHVPLAEVRQVAGVDRDGATALSILHAARWYGLRARGVKLELEGLAYLDRGAILHWEFSHFVVFDRLRKDGVEIVDPASGRRVVSFDQFNHSFTGVALALSPAEEFQQTGQQRNVVWSYVRQFLGQSRLWGRIVVVTVLLQLFALGMPLLTGTLVDRIIPRGDAGLLHLLGAGLAGIVVFSSLASVLRAQLLLHLRTKLDAKMTLGFLDHLVSLPFGFFQQRSEGDLMMRVNSNATIREMLTSSALSGLLDGALAISYLAILLMANVAMGAIVLSLALLQAAIFLFSYRRYQDLMSQDLQTQAKAQSYLVQMLTGIETLKANGVEERAVEQWSNLFVAGLNVSLARGRLSATVDSMMGALKSGSPLLVMWFGGWLALNGELSLGTMLALNALAAGFLGPVSTLISTALQLQLLRSYVDRIDDVLAAPPEQDKNEITPAPALRGEIELREISFGYSANSSSAGVQGVSVKIEPGQKVAIVGPSGAGKSTLAKLLLGLYRPSSGKILFDGVDISGYDLRSVRRQCGIVTQRSHLFSGTIRENISLNDPGIPLNAVIEASKLACLHRDVTGMPMGYETVLADGGSSISGGQRQRVALARALVNRPSVVLLDEATSELDAVTEAEAHRNLSGLNCTRIVIAHRLSTITDADLILVMNNGKLVEQGTHRELLENAGQYARLIAAQVDV